MISATVAYLRYRKPTALDLPPSGITRVLSSGYFIDAVYDALFTKPAARLSTSFLDATVEDRVFDQVGIGLWPRLAQSAGRALGRAQTGKVSTYLFYMLLALAILALAFFAGWGTL